MSEGLNIKVYSTPTCPYCIMTKEFLKDHKIEYTDIDISKEEAEAEKMVSKTGQMGVPVIEITGADNKEQYVIGFNKEELSEKLGIKE